MAIDRVCVAVGGPASDPERSRVLAVDLHRSRVLDAQGRITPAAGATDDDPRTVKKGTWPSYVAGVLAGFARHASARGVAPPSLDIAIATSVPLGSGLSSSASLEVAVATLLEVASGTKLDPVQKALLCQRAEHEFAGVPCGIMDQYVSVMGREGHALLIDCRSQEATPIPLPDPSAAVIVVMNTGVHHALASGEYAKRRAACAAAAAALGVPELRDATPDLLASRAAALTDEEARCARHVIGEIGRTREAAEALRGGDLGRVGRLMNASHDSLRDGYRVSCPELDTLVDSARAVPGVHGARMTGGGLGGCAVALCPPDLAASLAAEVERGYRARHGRECQVFRTRAAAGAGPVQV
jgi:galactokinase